MARPSEVPEWADEAPGDMITDPPLGKKQAGWGESSPGVGEKPLLQYFNWFMNLVYQWLAWADLYVPAVNETNTFTQPQLFDAGSGTSPTVTSVGTSTQPALYAVNSGTGAGAVMQGNASRAPVNLVPQAQPAGGSDGDVYEDSGSKQLFARLNGVWKQLLNYTDSHPAPVVVGAGGGAPAFQGAWVAGGAGVSAYNNLSFWKDGSGVVHLLGAAQVGAGAAAPVFILPAGWRPATGAGSGAGGVQPAYQFPALAYLTGTAPPAEPSFVTIEVLPNGTVQCPQFTNDCIVIFDSVSFRADQ